MRTWMRALSWPLRLQRRPCRFGPRSGCAKLGSGAWDVWWCLGRCALYPPVDSIRHFGATCDAKCGASPFPVLLQLVVPNIAQVCYKCCRRFALYEPVEFIRHFLLDKLEFNKVRESVAVHVPCSSKKMGIEESFMKVSHGHYYS
jgi:hypothetical protein